MLHAKEETRRLDRQNIRAKVYKIIYIILVLILIVIVIKALSSSLIFSHKDRINLVVYGKTMKFYSISTQDSTNYVLPFSSDLKVDVPGGYGSYRLGGLGKLIALEGKPQIFQKTVSSATSTYVDFYFYPKSDEVYYGDASQNTSKLPKVTELLLYPSNANLFDRLYLIFFFLQSKESDITLIDEFPITKTKNGLLFQAEAFAKKYQGFFYNKAYRNEKQTVQIIYTRSYKTALLLSRILEGNGIRVVDLSEESRPLKKCQVIEDENSFTHSSLSISTFFGCSLQKGKLSVSDILFIVGTELEGEWEIN